MNISPNDEKIEKYLNELADEYKVLLFKALIARSESLDDLSVSELLRIDSEIKKPLIKNYAKTQKMRRVLLLSGLTYSLLGFFLYIFNNALSSDFLLSTDPIALISVTIGFVGVFATIFSFALPILRLTSTRRSSNATKESLALLTYEVIAKWRELEGIVNDIGISENSLKPQSTLELLSTNQFIDDGDYKILKEFLKLRNNIVHATSNDYDNAEMSDLLTRVDKVIYKIKKLA